MNNTIKTVNIAGCSNCGADHIGLTVDGKTLTTTCPTSGKIIHIIYT